MMHQEIKTSIKLLHICEYTCYVPSGGPDEDVVNLHVGKEFAIALSSSGKVFYTGKSTALGLKQVCPAAQWNALPMAWGLGGQSALGKHLTAPGSHLKPSLYQASFRVAVYIFLSQSVS